MNRLRWVSPLLALALVSVVGAADTKKGEKPLTKEKIATTGKVIGELVKLDSKSKDFTVKVTYYELNPKKYQDLVNWDARRRVEISRIRNAAERARQINQYAYDRDKRTREAYDKKTSDVKFESADNIKVRYKKAPVQYDDKGNPKKLSKKELAELKGPDKSLPGYTAEFDNLQKGQTVEVRFPKKKAKPKTKSKTTEGSEKDEELLDETPKATMIIIMSEKKEK